MPQSISEITLIRELKSIQKYSDVFSVGLNNNNIFEWDILIFGQENTIYEGTFLNGRMKFPKNFPNYPPNFQFTTKMFHPNIYEDGKVCLSILHDPGEDKYEYESASERWRPVITVYSIIQSIILILNQPNLDSPANIDAAIMYKEDENKYKKYIKNLLEN